MSARGLVALGALAGAAWLLWRRSGTSLAVDSLTPPLALPDGFSDPFLPPGLYSPADQAAPAPGGGSDYAARLIAAESGGDPSAKNPGSSASGVYQFTKKTWQAVGGAWGSDPSKAFGGLTPSLAEQTARFNQLTAANAAGLLRKGISVTDAALYIAHFLGLPTALRVLAASPSASLAAVVGSDVMTANPKLSGFTVADFLSWASGKA